MLKHGKALCVLGLVLLCLDFTYCAPGIQPAAAIDAQVAEASSVEATAPCALALGADAHIDATDVLATDTSLPEPDPLSFPLDPDTCDGRRLTLDWDTTHANVPLWHLCYITPVVQASDDPHDRHAPFSVTFTRRSGWPGPPCEMLTVRGTGHLQWIASALLLVPRAPAGYPLFNARGNYGETGSDFSLWAVQADESGHALQSGDVLAWRVLPDGTQVRWPLRPIVNGCLEELTPEVPNGGSLLPDGESCPDEFYWCGPGRFHCEYES